MRVAGWGTKSIDVVAGVARCKPEVALVGVRLEDGERAGLQVLIDLQPVLPDTRIIMLLDSSEPSIVVEAFRRGAKGVFSREQMSSGLAKCIRCVLAGQLWANNEQLEFLVHDLRARTAKDVTLATNSDLLTKRELEVGTLVANGLTNRDIAEQLGLSQQTVRNYLLTVFDKLHVSTRVELALVLAGRRNQRLAVTSDISSDHDSAISA
jgi:DNA-binding NarL/FixJ family response regulator